MKKLNLFLTETFLQSLQSLKEIEIEIEILFFEALKMPLNLPKLILKVLKSQKIIICSRKMHRFSWSKFEDYLHVEGLICFPYKFLCQNCMIQQSKL